MRGRGEGIAVIILCIVGVELSCSSALAVNGDEGEERGYCMQLSYCVLWVLNCPVAQPYRCCSDEGEGRGCCSYHIVLWVLNCPVAQP